MREITDSLSTEKDKRWRVSAVEALQEAAEAYLVSMLLPSHAGVVTSLCASLLCSNTECAMMMQVSVLEDSNVCAIHAGRVTIM